MFIRFIETVADKFANVETIEFLGVATCFYCWRHVAANGDRAVV